MDDDARALLGRIVALELIARAFLTREATSQFSADPVQGIDDMRKQLLASVQLAERGINAEADAVWDEAVAALNANFAEVKKRLIHLAGSASPSPRAPE